MMFRCKSGIRVDWLFRIDRASLAVVASMAGSAAEKTDASELMRCCVSYPAHIPEDDRQIHT